MRVYPYKGMPIDTHRRFSLHTQAVLLSSIALVTSACCKKSAPDPTHHDPGATTTTPTTTATTPATATATATATNVPKPKNNSIHLTLGVPKDSDASDDYLLVRKQYALSYNKNLNDPNWVSWNTDAGSFGDAPRFKGGFMADDELPSSMYHVRHDDYTNSGYDRGHMVRSEERTKNDEDNKSTFFTTNILPQYHDLNAGPWLKLEDYVQKLAQKDKKELFIVAGGIFDKKPPTIGKGVAVPKQCFKIVTVLDRGGGLADVNDKTRVIAVIMPNEKGIITNDWGRYRTSVDKIEEATGYDFMPDVPEAIQKVIESKVDTGPLD
ncbi:MAG: DNA/RNA non-specific endonuclease [Polyangiaceae bacterium]